MFKIKRTNYNNGIWYIVYKVSLMFFNIRVITLYRYLTYRDPYSMRRNILKFELLYQNSEALAWLKILKNLL